MSDKQPATVAAPGSSNSLLEDASTLLMFHNAAVTNNSPPQSHNQIAQPSQDESNERPIQPLTKSSTTSLLPSHTVKPAPLVTSRPSSTPNPTSIRSPRINNLASPGPAIAALADSDNEGEPDKSQKAIVAAAALAAAAGVPLPLINHNDQHGLNQQIIEKLKEQGAKSSEEILQKAQNEVSKEQLQALQERAEVIRQGLQNKNEEEKNGIKQESTTNISSDNGTKQDDETSIEADTSKNNNSNETDVEMKDEVNTSNATTTNNNNNNNNIQNNETEEETSTSQLPEQDEEHEQEPEPKPKKQRKTKKKETRTEGVAAVPKDQIVDPDAGIISCVCGFEDDDGFTIQCDNCYRWQHAVCMGIRSIDNAPDDYLCNVCSPRKIDIKKAKALQTQRLSALKRKKEKRNRGSADSETQENSGVDSIEGKDKDQSTQGKPSKPKPKPTAYGKNLEDEDIHVLDPKDSYKTIYYALNDYDFQDEKIYNFVDSLKKLDNPLFYKISKVDFDNTQFPKLSVRAYSEINNKKFSGISRLGLFTESPVAAGDLIGEYLGDVGSKDSYVADSRNHYRIWGVEKPNVQFIPGLPLAIDARNSGNLTRFVRRSCNANCELQTVVVQKDLVKFCVRAIKTIKPGAEITLNWNWDVNHPIKAIEEGRPFDQTSDAVKPSLVLSVESILSFTECACTQLNECSLSKVKKASAHIYRATRKGNNTSGLKLLQKEAQYKSIQERLFENETSNLRDSLDQVKSSIPIPNRSGSTQEDINIRPFIYNYISRKRKLDESSTQQKQQALPPQQQQQQIPQPQYLPIPVELMTVETNTVKDTTSTTPAANVPPKPVKKMSFADYKKKKKPT